MAVDPVVAGYLQGVREELDALDVTDPWRARLGTDRPLTPVDD